MHISDIDPSRKYLPLVQQNMDAKNIQPSEDFRFVDTLKDFVQDVNGLQKESGALQEAFIKGDPVDLHDVMIASQKAGTTFQLLLELRNKGLDLYRTVMRMQV